MLPTVRPIVLAARSIALPSIGAENSRAALRRHAPAGRQQKRLEAREGEPPTLLDAAEMALSAGAQAFSGTAVYAAKFNTDRLAQSARAELDLGRVEVIASVRVNDQPAGTVWTTPYRLDITPTVLGARLTARCIVRRPSTVLSHDVH